MRAFFIPMSFFDEIFPPYAQRLKVLARKSFGCKKWFSLKLSSKRWKMQLFRIKAFLGVGQSSHVSDMKIGCYRTEKSPCCRSQDTTSTQTVCRPRTQPSPCVMCSWLEQTSSHGPVLKAKKTRCFWSACWIPAQGSFCLRKTQKMHILICRINVLLVFAAGAALLVASIIRAMRNIQTKGVFRFQPWLIGARLFASWAHHASRAMMVEFWVGKPFVYL